MSDLKGGALVVAQEVEKILSGEVVDPLPPAGQRPVAPFKRMGVPGYTITNGWLMPVETDSRLSSQERYRVYSENFVNVGIVGTAVRYFLDMIAGAGWSFEPAKDSEAAGDEIADFFTDAFDNMETPPERVMRRAAMYKMYGFSLQEITLGKREDGRVGLADIEPRAQKTIERWHVDDNGYVQGVYQRNPNTGRELYIPRAKLLYMVDDSLSDSPEGLGLFRHAIRTAAGLRRFEDLEHWGFETDLQGIPLGRAPYSMLQKLVDDGHMKKEEMRQTLFVIENFIANHIRGPKTGLVLDSQTYTTTDERTAPSTQRLWDIELMNSGGTSHAQINDAIKRKTWELARLFGVEHLLVGSDGAGSLALHKSSTLRMHAMVNSCLGEIVSTVNRQVVPILCQFNGVPDKLKPKLKAEKVAYRTVEEITGALANLSTAGAPLLPTDPAVGEVRDILGLSRPDMADVMMAGVERLAGLGLPMDDDQGGREGQEDGGSGGRGNRSGGSARRPAGRSGGGGSMRRTLDELSEYLAGSRESA